jgi:hypothetical protein
VLAGIPGLALLGALLVRPGAVEGLYRQGVYQVIELADADFTRPQRSVWLPLRDGIFRAVLSREWLELARSKVARIQIMIWVAGTVGVLVAGRAMAGQPLPRVIQFVGGLSLFAWFMAYGHWVVRVFEKERKTVLLYRLTNVPARKLVLAKFISVFAPSAVLVAVSALVGGFAAGAGLQGALAVTGWSLAALAAGTFGGFGMAAATANEYEDAEMDASPRREGTEGPQATGNAWWVLARTFALIIPAALAVWLAAGHPGLPWAAAAVPLGAFATLLPLLLLVGGYWWMTRTWERRT